MNELTISVALCTYNGEKFLQEQLQSIARQSRRPDELVVCDDNSSDQSPSISERFAASAPFPVRIIRNKNNIGSTKNFENAISQCRGAVIALSDQDDIWHKDKLKCFDEVFNISADIGLVFSNANIVTEDLTQMGYSLWDTYSFTNREKNSVLKGRSFELLLNHNVITGATMAFRSSYRERILPISSLWVHDAWIAIVLSVYSSIRLIDRPLIEYRQHSAQQIGGIDKDLSAKMAISRAVAGYYPQIRQWEDVVDHLKEQSSNEANLRIAAIMDKIEHLRARSALNQSTWLGKTANCTRELLTGRYHSYSNGYLSFFKDMLILSR